MEGSFGFALMIASLIEFHAAKKEAYLHMTLPKLDGPRIPAQSGKARQLVVFLHGYGADGRDLIDIGKQWQGMLPDAAFVSPHAHEPCGQSPTGRQWFPLTFRDEGERWRGCVNAHPVLDAFLDAELAKHGLDDRHLVLVGFSQGTMMSLHGGLRRKQAPLAIVGYAGMLALEPGKGAETLAQETAIRPPVLLVHGSEDQVIPVEALFMSAQILAEAEIPAEFHLSLGLPHSIDGEGLRHGVEFIAAAIKRTSHA
jgi:phospholipase/carboxylesterase